MFQLPLIYLRLEEARFSKIQSKWNYFSWTNIFWHLTIFWLHSRSPVWCWKINFCKLLMTLIFKIVGSRGRVWLLYYICSRFRPIDKCESRSVTVSKMELMKRCWKLMKATYWASEKGMNLIASNGDCETASERISQ